ncbi:hypothetical protein VPHG_00058 [Vibrio phage 11895-B1]|uniref:hypothetical protein n=1 Tax=Vibrio phage 11895-B1 TaxID=754075 RepID=UPI0002C0F8BE|nr:hypothetical protein VPHG_00058 [Vibrio phage 11895-B1]AGH32125.1 hypothetical protein VPHG_00058 [Vibrio phage 11895-B1]
MIKCKEDLYNKYIPMEEGGLRGKFIEVCNKFGIHPAFSFSIDMSQKYYEVTNNDGRYYEVYRTNSLDKQSTPLTLEDFMEESNVAQFKLGDRVVLSKQSEFYRESLELPECQLSTEGVITRYDEEENYGITVDWFVGSEKFCNGYNEEDLILVETLHDDLSVHNKELSESTTDASDNKDTQTYQDNLKTLQEAAQTLGEPITIHPDGEITVWDNYSEEEITIKTVDKVVEYVNLIKQIKMFQEE